MNGLYRCSIWKGNVNVYESTSSLGAVGLHFDRIQTTAAIPFRSVHEEEREREGMKRKQRQLKES